MKICILKFTATHTTHNEFVVPGRCIHCSQNIILFWKVVQTTEQQYNFHTMQREWSIVKMKKSETQRLVLFFVDSMFHELYNEVQAKQLENASKNSVTQWQSVYNLMKSVSLFVSVNITYYLSNFHWTHRIPFICFCVVMHAYMWNEVGLNYTQSTLYGAYRIWRCCYLVAIKVNVPEAIEMLLYAYHCSIC